MAEVVAFRPLRRKTAAEKAKENRTELTIILCAALDAIATLIGKPSAAEADFHDCTKVLHELLYVNAWEVRLAVTTTIGLLAQTNLQAKEELCLLNVMPGLIGVLQKGGLEAIKTISILTEEREDACNQLMAIDGGIDLLTSYVQNDDEDADKDDNSSMGQEREEISGSGGGNRKAMERTAEKMRSSQKGRHREASTDSSTSAAEAGGGQTWTALADLEGGLQPGMTEAKTGLKVERPTIVPVASKTEAVSTLRNVATSNLTNRTAITNKQVIPQLVKLMTRMRVSLCGSD